MAQSLPEGFAVVPEFLTPAEELDLLQFIRALEFRTFEMHGVVARRRIVQFGFHYSFQSYRLTEAAPIPAEFASIRARSAALAGIAPAEFAEALVTEYRPVAGIGHCPSLLLLPAARPAGADRTPYRTRLRAHKGPD
jgi:hypothetical protein